MVSETAWEVVDVAMLMQAAAVMVHAHAHTTERMPTHTSVLCAYLRFCELVYTHDHARASAWSGAPRLMFQTMHGPFFFLSFDANDQNDKMFYFF